MSTTEIAVQNENDNNDKLQIVSNNLLVDNEFDDIEVVIDSDIGDINALYDVVNADLKEHLGNINQTNQNQPTRLGAIRPQQKRISPVYISAQVSNLCSMKSTKLQLLKEKARLRETKIDREIKLFLALNKNNDLDKNEITEKDVLNYLIQQGKTKASTAIGNEERNNIVEGEFIDMELEEALQELESNNEKELLVSEVENKESLEDEDIIVIDGDTIRIIYVLEEDKCYLINETEIIREMDSDEVNLEMMDEDENIVIDTISNTTVEVIE